MTPAYTNCMCSSKDKQKVFYLSGLQKLTVENLFPLLTSIPFSYSFSSRSFLRASTLLRCIRKSENMPLNNLHLFCLCLFFTLNFCALHLDVPSSLSALTGLALSHPISDCCPPNCSDIIFHLPNSKQLNLTLLHPPMSLLSHLSSA